MFIRKFCTDLCLEWRTGYLHCGIRRRITAVVVRRIQGVCSFSKVRNKNHRNNSVCLFIAEGVEIDQKVAKANAALLIK